MKKNRWVYVLIVIVIVGILIWRNTGKVKYEKSFTEFDLYGFEKSILLDYLYDHFITDDLIRTNILDTKQVESASGQDILSESCGLMLQYFYRNDRKNEFDSLVNKLKDLFINSNGLIKWRIRVGEDKLNTVNASLDDMRIIKILIEAGKSWDVPGYIEFAKSLSDNLLQHCTRGNSLKSYDSLDSPDAPFVYYDFEAIYLMGEFDERWHKVFGYGVDNIVKDKGDAPFYMSVGGKYPMIENLLILMHFCEIGMIDLNGIKWLKETMDQGILYGTYEEDKTAAVDLESPAVYGIAACIAKLSGDKDLYVLACENLKRMQNLEENDFYGGFIDLDDIKSYSFDNLYALLGY